MGDETPLAAEVIPRLVERLVASYPGRVYREALALLERPLLLHALAATGGNQLRAARLLGLNRNTLRKRCRELRLPLPGALRTWGASKGPPSPRTLGSAPAKPWRSSVPAPGDAQ